MSTPAKQGRSEATGPKEALISACVGWGLKHMRPGDGRYCVFDLNAGEPTNHIGGRRYRGTTQTIYDKLESKSQRSVVWWVDKDKTVIPVLQSRASCNGHLFGGEPLILVHVVRADNAVFSPTIPDRISEIGAKASNTRGVIIADPNGLDVPLQGIRTALDRAPYLDVIIHIGSFKQVWSYWDRSTSDDFRETGEKVASFAQIFDTLRRASWLVSEPFRPPSGQGRDHVVLYGSNLRYVPALEKWGLPAMRRIDSPDGKSLLQRIERRGVA